MNKAQQNAAIRNWNKCLLASSFFHLQHIVTGNFCTNSEKRRLVRVLNILRNVKKDWDGNWEEVKENLKK